MRAPPSRGAQIQKSKVKSLRLLESPGRSHDLICKSVGGAGSVGVEWGCLNGVVGMWIFGELGEIARSVGSSDATTFQMPLPRGVASDQSDRRLAVHSAIQGTSE